MKNNKKPVDPFWSEALAVFAKIGGWIAGPVIIALFLGQWLDQRYQTTNKYLIISVATAFVISNIGLIIEVLKYNKKIKQIEREAKNERQRN